MTTQESLFQCIKERLPSNISFVHDLSELLEISYDSAYRRIRGEKEISIEEFRKICLHYTISADNLFQLPSGSMIFSTRAIGQDGYTFRQWLETITMEMKAIHASKEKEIIYAAKDIPIFYYFEFPEIAAFKIYFWHKALLPVSSVSEPDFSFSVSDELISAGKQIMAISRTIPTVEIWNEETITSFLRQIDYCFVSGYFKSKEDAIRLTDVLEVWVRHVQNQAELGFKFAHGTQPDGIPDSFKLFYNDVFLSDNSIVVNVDGNRTTYLTYNIINLLVSTNEVFCKQIENSMKVIMQRSTLISGTSAKERNRFFNLLIMKIKVAREHIERS
jgi:hypothetical protein